MSVKAYPGYEYHLSLYPIIAHGTEEEKAAALKAQREYITGYTLPEGMTMEDITIQGPEGDPLTLRIYTPANLPENAPMVLEIHGGGWIGGNLDIDNYRCISLATQTPCLVISVDYRLSNETVHFPAPLMDCYTALNWIYDHAQELGGNKEKIALHGTSAGGNLVGGLALYVRDHGGPKISLAVMNCPALTLENSISKQQYPQFALSDADGDKRKAADSIYLGGLQGTRPSYYAFPDYCSDLSGLPPTYMVVAEYDILRDEGIAYATRLLQTGVPCEIVVAPRVGHGFCVVDHPLTRWIHKGICASFRREFDMEVVDF